MFIASIVDYRKKVWGECECPFKRIIYINPEKDCNSSGVSAQYWKYGKDGLKSYFSIEEAMDAYNTQKAACHLGIAPSVKDLVLVIISYPYGLDDKYDVDPKIQFGYLTEVATPISWKNRKQFYEQIDMVRMKLLEVGIDSDNGKEDYRNYGFIGDKLVFIDFGSHSKSDW